MTIAKRVGKKVLPILFAAVLAMFSFSLTAYAAEEEPSATSSDTQASISFTAGELRLASAPVLDFGSHSVSNQVQEYAATGTILPIQVSDLRGSGKGWDLMAALSSFTLKEDGATTLKAAAIKTTSPTINAVDGTVGTPPAAAAEISIASDGQETPIWTAAGNTGMGVWEMVWNAANTKLVVQPGTERTGTSVATITWSLQSTP